MPDDQAEVSRGHISSALRDEGPNPEKGKDPACAVAAKNPTGGADSRRVSDQPDPDVNLLGRILSRPNMLKAWERVKANKGALAMDNMPIADFMAFAREHWEEIRVSHLAGTYQPLPVNWVEIPKPSGGTCSLEITILLDLLMNRVAWKICDQLVLRLIGKYLRARVMIDGRRRDTRKGVPQGGPLSPLLSNTECDNENETHSATTRNC